VSRAQFKIDPSAARQTAQLRKQLQANLQLVAHEAEKNARTMAVLGASAGIYDTEEGHYQRSENYLLSIYARATPTPTGVLVEVGDTAQYASQLEYGALGDEVPAEVAVQMAEAIGSEEKTLYLGRTGHLYYVANPAITRAAVFAGLRMTEQFARLVAAQARRSGP
jgi:hypothetical protein